MYGLYSQEGVGGILQWGFWDQLKGKPCTAITTGDDCHPNEAGVAYQNIYHEVIRTKVILDPLEVRDNQAYFRFRAFKGTYEIAFIDEEGNDVKIIGSNIEVDDNAELHL